jgi:hypothetical protein
MRLPGRRWHVALRRRDARRRHARHGSCGMPIQDADPRTSDLRANDQPPSGTILGERSFSARASRRHAHSTRHELCGNGSGRARARGFRRHMPHGWRLLHARDHERRCAGARPPHQKRKWPRRRFRLRRYARECTAVRRHRLRIDRRDCMRSQRQRRTSPRSATQRWAR